MGGFALKPFWLILGVLFYGRGMEKTGLAKRISYLTLGILPPTYGNILLGFTIIGFVLALGIPSITVRIAIILPVAWALALALGLEERSQGSAFITLGAWTMSIFPGYAFLTGSLFGPFFMGAIPPEMRSHFTWASWLYAFFPPVLVLCLLLFVALLVLFRPKEPLHGGREIIAREMRKLGPLGRQEGVVLAVVLGSVAAWVTQPLHGVDSSYVAMLGLGALFAGGVLDASDFQSGVSWPLLVFMGGIMSFEIILPAFGLDRWLGSLFLPVAQPFLGNAFLMTIVVSLIVYLVRFVEVALWPTFLILYLPLVGSTAGLGIDPHVLAVIIVLSTNVLFFPYQMAWLPMGEAITGGRGWTAGHRTQLALAFSLLNIVALLVGVLYWQAIGLVR